jgi:hypothetical protein
MIITGVMDRGGGPKPRYCSNRVISTTGTVCNISFEEKSPRITTIRTAAYSLNGKYHTGSTRILHDGFQTTNITTHPYDVSRLRVWSKLLILYRTVLLDFAT